MGKIYTAAMVVIGNEILSGRTQDKNINYVANTLNPKGISLVEVRIIPDVEETVVRTIHDLRDQVDYIFTSGGIGPTHDDITAECVAKSHGVALERNEEAYKILLDYYGEADFTEARQRMARIPVGATLIPNPVSAAPGFNIGNVYVMAGVPRIMQAMMDYVVSVIAGGDVMQSRSVTCSIPESILSAGLSEINDRYDAVDIGSYPRFVEGGVSVQVVMRSVDVAQLEGAEKDVEALVRELSV